ncbi:MAG: hypothetical protein ABF507_06485, partial [Bifidobacterium aquikefiri]|uniref:hypothetical protein n=1 Tax=Bifidobacterium aquikefiri TaxID=1653207 RepID=UPI0039E89F00
LVHARNGKAAFLRAIFASRRYRRKINYFVASVFNRPFEIVETTVEKIPYTHHSPKTGNKITKKLFQQSALKTSIDRLTGIHNLFHTFC